MGARDGERARPGAGELLSRPACLAARRGHPAASTRRDQRGGATVTFDRSYSALPPSFSAVRTEGATPALFGVRLLATAVPLAQLAALLPWSKATDSCRTAKGLA